MIDRDVITGYFLFTWMGYMLGVATMFWIGRVKERDE